MNKQPKKADWLHDIQGSKLNVKRVAAIPGHSIACCSDVPFCQESLFEVLSPVPIVAFAVSRIEQLQKPGEAPFTLAVLRANAVHRKLRQVTSPWSFRIHKFKFSSSKAIEPSNASSIEPGFCLRCS